MLNLFTRNNKIKTLKSYDLKNEFKKIISILMCFLFVGLFLSILLFLFIYVDGNYLERPVCFEESCIKGFVTVFSFPYYIFKGFFDIFFGAVAVLGIYFGVQNYFLSSDTSKVYNHIESYKLFDAYVKSEVEKLEYLNFKNINVFKFYNKIFPGSKVGSLVVSRDYENLILKINDSISKSNNEVKSIDPKDFKYVKHQQRIIPVLFDLGFDLTYMGRVDFYNIENQVFTLINIINEEFLGQTGVIDVASVRYV